MVEVTTVAPIFDGSVTNRTDPGGSLAVEDDGLALVTGVVQVDTPKIVEKIMQDTTVDSISNGSKTLFARNPRTFLTPISY